MIKRKVLFVTPFMDYTGSRIFLWRFFKSFDRNLIDVAVYSHHYGELVNVMPSDVKMYFFHKKKESKYMYSFKRFWNRRNNDNPYRYKFLKVIKDFRPEIIVLNTIAPGYTAKIARDKNLKLVTLVHELPFAYSGVDYFSFKNIIDLSDLLIGSSKIVCEELRKMGRRDSIIQNGFVDISEIQIKRNRVGLRLSLGIKNDEFVWVCAGTFSLSKGGDLFLRIALELISEKVKFVWVGDMNETGYAYYAEKIISKLPKGNVIVTGYKKYDEYYDYLRVGDGFLLLSHYESFSLTTLEAVSIGLPVLCYDCGGVTDFVNNNNGLIIKTRDPKMWVNSMRKIMRHELIFDSRKIRRSVNHLISDIQVPKLTNSILSVI